MNVFATFRRFDWIIFFAIIVLVAAGLSIQYSLSLNAHEILPSTFTRQAIFVGFGLVLFFFFSSINFRALKAYAPFLYIFILLLLVGVLFFGRVYRGVKGWLSIGPFNIQLVEFAKIILVISLASFWAKYRERFVPIWRVVLSFLIVLLPLILVILQPDLGSGLLLVGLWLAIFLLADRQIKHVVLVGLTIVLIIVISWFFLLKDYQKERVLTYLNPHRDPLGAGWQVSQSIVAVGSGKFLGRGLGLGPQSQLKFLPAAKTDFVFAALGEELGFLGCFLVLGAFFVLFFRMLRVARESSDDFGVILALGMASLFFIQVVANIGMNLGILPITGIPLPLISYGGSSLIVSLISFGILESIYIYRRTV